MCGTVCIRRPYTGASSREQSALFTHVCVSMRWMDGWQTCHSYLPPFHVTFLSRRGLKQRCSMSVTLTLLVRETAGDNQERTNDVLRTPRCVTFDHAPTVDVVACPHDACDTQQLLYRWEEDGAVRKSSAYFSNLFKLRLFLFEKWYVGVFCRAKALYCHCLSVTNGVEQWEARTPASAAW